MRSAERTGKFSEVLRDATGVPGTLPIAWEEGRVGGRAAVGDVGHYLGAGIVVRRSRRRRGLTPESFVMAPDGVRLSVRLVGEGQQTVVVSGTGNEADFLRLARGRRVAFYDVRNRGRSDRVDEEGRVGIPAEVDDVDVVRSDVGFAQTNLFGWSYVGLILALYAASYGEHVERLVMVCPASPSRALEPEPSGLDDAVVERLMALAGTDLAQSDPVRFAREWRQIVTPSRIRDPSAFAMFEADRSIWPNEWPDHMMNALARVASSHPVDFDYLPQARLIAASTLVIHGEDDPIPIEASRAWASSIPDARLLVLPQVGHFPQVESPEALFAAVETFLGGTWPDQAT